MKIYVLTTPYVLKGKEHQLHPVLIETEQDLFLVDCGYAGFMPLIADSMKAYQKELNDLTGVIVTHHDVDHCGGLAELKSAFPQLKVYASSLESLYISGKRKSQRLYQVQSQQKQIDAISVEVALAIENMRPVPVDVCIDEAWRTDICVIPTPGHTIGHISLYIPALKTLIAADAFVVEDDRFAVANLHFTIDLPNAIHSIQKLRNLPLERVICYHGGEVTAAIEERFDELLTFF